MGFVRGHSFIVRNFSKSLLEINEINMELHLSQCPAERKENPKAPLVRAEALAQRDENLIFEQELWPGLWM